MKRTFIFFLWLLFLCLFTGNISAQTMATNPYLWADIPDLSMIRVGDTYYMSSTTMHMNPGVPIMKSKDLVNWELINYCHTTLASTDGYNLNNGKQEYGHGSWASSIRYVNGTYYVATFANTGKTYIYKTTNIETGPWTVSVLNASYHDCSLFFDDDNRVYLIYGNGDIRIIELTTDAAAIKAGGVNKILIPDAAGIAGTGGLRAEGTQVQKINGYYYVSNICWPSGSMRTQIVHRSTSITGTYEGKVALKDQGVAQGAFIDTPDGKWYAYLFKDNGAVGRIPYLVPMTWTNGWPVLGTNGKVPTTLDIPKGRGGLGNIVASDEFTQASPLKLAWQWNHNPQNNYWSLSQRTGYLRLTNERTDPNVLMTTNTLTQRTFGPKSSAYTSIDVSGMKDGDYAGIVALQKQYGYVGVKMSGSTKTIVMVRGDDVTGTPSEVASIPLNQNTVYVRIDMDFTNQTDKAYFYYSLNGSTWTAIGSTLQMAYTIPHFMGYRFGLFTYATKLAGGYADFDFYRVGANITEAQNVGPAVSFTSPAAASTFTVGSAISLAAIATTSTGSVTNVKFYDGTTLLNTDNSSPYSFSWTNALAGTHKLKVVATDGNGKTAEDSITIKVNVPQGPYNGKVHTIPGRIEAEEYDLGGEGLAYHEANTNGNEGKATLRNDEVDIETTGDIDGVYNVGYILQGEWLEYTVDVLSTGSYNLDLRVAANGDGKVFHIEIDGVNVTGDIAVSNTGGWQTWKTVSLNGINLTEGTHVMRIAFDASYMNLNYAEFNDVITGISEESKSKVILYPNPFGESGTTIGQNGFFTYAIYDLSGHLIESGSGLDKKSVGLNLSSGTYLMSIKNDSGIFVQKIINY